MSDEKTVYDLQIPPQNLYFFFFAPRLSLVVFLVLPYEESNVALGKKWRRENMHGVLMLYSAFLMKAK